MYHRSVFSHVTLKKILNRIRKQQFFPCLFNILELPLRGGGGGGAILTTKLLLRTRFLTIIIFWKPKLPQLSRFAEIFSIEESFHILKPRPYLTIQVIITEKTLKFKRRLVLDNTASINSESITTCIM